MKLLFTNTYSQNPRMLIRRAGYGESVDPRSGEVSYMRKLGGNLYPRFHAYLERLPNGFQINLHLDQKQASYRGHTSHNGEYDGETVEKEGERVKAVIESMKM